MLRAFVEHNLLGIESEKNKKLPGFVEHNLLGFERDRPYRTSA